MESRGEKLVDATIEKFERLIPDEADIAQEAPKKAQEEEEKT